MRPAALLSAILALGWAAPAAAGPSLWTVHGPACQAVLFGSVHVLPQGVNWRPPALDRALRDADELWFEIPLDPDAQDRIGALALAKGLLPQGQSLLAMLSAQGAGRLKAEAEQYKLPLERLDRMRPWLADLAISTALYQSAGGRQDQGVEEQLADAAPQARRKAFETAAQQIDLFADASQAEQIASLESTLRGAPSGARDYRRLIGEWLKGEDAAIYKHDVTDLKRETPALFKALITDRNAAWTRILVERLAAPCKGAVVVVGAGHLLGPDGVPARLRALGFKVDGPRE